MATDGFSEYVLKCDRRNHINIRSITSAFHGYLDVVGKVVLVYRKNLMIISLIAISHSA